MTRDKDYGWEPEIIEYLKAKGEIPGDYLASNFSDFLSWFEAQEVADDEDVQ